MNLTAFCSAKLHMAPQKAINEYAKASRQASTSPSDPGLEAQVLANLEEACMHDDLASSNGVLGREKEIRASWKGQQHRTPRSSSSAPVRPANRGDLCRARHAGGRS